MDKGPLSDKASDHHSVESIKGAALDRISREWWRFASINRAPGKRAGPIRVGGMASGGQYNIDPQLFVSLAGAETTFGNNITAGQFNAFNVLYHGMNSPFSSFQSAINSVGHRLTKPRNGHDFTNTATLYGHYCSGAGCAAGLKNLNTFINQQGANTSALHYPKKD